MFGFFKEVNIRQGGDCHGMWLILRVEALAFQAYPLCSRGKIIG